MKEAVERYFWNILVLMTQNINTILLAGNPDETTSSRAYRKDWTKSIKFINWLFRDPTHCRRAYEAEKHKVASWNR